MHRTAAPGREQVIDGNGRGPLDLLVQQLWMPAVRSERARVVVNPDDSAEWYDAELYWAVPSASAARLLVPTGPQIATARVLANYRRLRTPLNRHVRTVAAAASRARLPLGRDRVIVQVRTGEDAAGALPLRAIAAALQRPRLYAALGVRTSANRKATLQLVDHRGAPVGYAKLSWSAATRTYVDTETSALRSLGGGRGTVRVPELLAAGSSGEHSYLVSQPLPLSARRLDRTEPMPAPQEMAMLCPVHRRSIASGTDQFRALSRRIDALPASVAGNGLADRMRRLRTRVAGSEQNVPVTERWHGDLVPWNTARDAEYRLWCWDWESSEEDAVAGLDAIHWAVSRARQRPEGITGHTLQDALHDSRIHLWGAGIPRHDWGLAAAVYALTTAERACALAVDSGDWGSVWVGQDRLALLLASAEALLEESPGADPIRRHRRAGRRP